MGLQAFFSNHSETRDKHSDELLKSHYYKTTNKKAIEAVKKVIHNLDGYHLNSVSEERGEISISIKKGRKAFVVATVVSVRPFETAIDFAVTTETLLLPIDFGYSRKVILNLYQHLDKELPLIGKGEL
ncbi:cytosolic protein [Bacillus sp. HNG]|uniref:cytosolic protein n=1 Tax=Bacillaceae TaxID=186817 RepID=UPI000E2E99AE|nr:MULTISPECIES: cytosolic protein [Bacillaceae]MDR4889197.1 cytosolic protein [Fredinandcohnia sp. QZ13]RFB17768.1 cytosolic protein [Bacillus sp. HNG]